ncbi:Crp/Fnr family transcriptional regulator [Limobrevibacterium gyesilva]|uniref:Crp/Fnr family transcriptional regulator n=1 Tax=Limobrevibacterium gyesilva TaxID=2991712 RepID=A0AA41YKK0_9PROT|nr:Crp/Fnr family transcriptional regulator [Limobrevibacterium gyesilva]MCW3473578.1 Crp/Fnr family transcriptional regulator [Limobrevibacterium gyesilva]
MARSAPAGDLDEAVHGLIGKNPILGSLPPEERRVLVRRSAVLTLEAREPLFAEGDEGRALYVVLQGFVKLASTTPSGREVILNVAGPGNVFGELAVLNGWARAASAVALSPCRLLSIDGRMLTQALAKTPQAMLAVIRLLSERLSATTAQMTDAVDLPAPARLAKALIHLASLHARADPDGLCIGLRLSQQELGALTGLTRESINKHLAHFRDAGCVRLSGRDITVVDLGALRQYL